MLSDLYQRNAASLSMSWPMAVIDDVLRSVLVQYHFHSCMNSTAQLMPCLTLRGTGFELHRPHLIQRYLSTRDSSDEGEHDCLWRPYFSLGLVRDQVSYCVNRYLRVPKTFSTKQRIQLVVR